MIVSDGFWRRQLGADPNGRSAASLFARLAARSPIIGVMPARFRVFFARKNVYAGLVPEASSGILDRGNHQGLSALGARWRATE